MKKYFQLLTLIFITSCASHKEAPPEKIYSEDTNRTFEMIESGGSYYLQKAPDYNPPPQISAPVKRRAKVLEAPARSEEFDIDEKINYQAKPLTQEIRSNPQSEDLQAPIKNPPSTTNKTDERLIEINQNLAFYCMKHRKRPAYGGDESKCMNFVNSVMEKCQKQHRIVNSKLLNCIQKKLK